MSLWFQWCVLIFVQSVKLTLEATNTDSLAVLCRGRVEDWFRCIMQLFVLRDVPENVYVHPEQLCHCTVYFQQSKLLNYCRLIWRVDRQVIQTHKQVSEMRTEQCLFCKVADCEYHQYRAHSWVPFRYVWQFLIDKHGCHHYFDWTTSSVTTINF